MTFRLSSSFLPLLILASAAPARGQEILSLDSLRTGDGVLGGDDLFLTSGAMGQATDLLLGAGFTIRTTTRFLWSETAGADVLFTGMVDVPYLSTEIADVLDFVEAGGGLVIMRDWGPYYPQGDPLASTFGVTYSGAAVGPASPSPVHKSVSHPIWDGPAGSVDAFDQIYSNALMSGVDIIGTHDTDGSTGLGVIEFGEGRIVFLTDSSAFLDAVGTDLAPGSATSTVWQNIFHYAAGSDPVGTPYCTAQPNSESVDGSNLSATGSASLAEASLTLRADDAPFGPALFVVGPATASVVFGNGVKCVGGGLTLLGVRPRTAGSFVMTVDFGAHGTTLAGMGTAYFQCWYRDLAGTGARYNTSDALEVVFVP